MERATSDTGDSLASAAQSSASSRASAWQLASRALTTPHTVLAVLRSRLALRGCKTLPWSVRVEGRLRVAAYAGIFVGERVRMDGRTVPIELAAWDGPIRIGDDTYINYGTSISAHSGVTIGKHCLIGNHVLIMDSDYHDLHDRTLPGKTSPITIEDNVWVGTRALILKGVRIGEGAVVAAGATVVEDVPPRTMVGNPTARVLRAL